MNTMPAVFENKIVDGLIIEAVRVDADGLTKQALWLIDETFAALLSVIGDYLKERGEACLPSTSQAPTEPNPAG